MIKTTLLTITAVLGLTSLGQATIVTLSGGRTGPFVITSADGTAVNGGLIRLGTLTGAPASSSVDDINAVFQEFATGFTAANGNPGQTFNNGAAAAFDGDQIYIWIFNTPSTAPAAGQEHGMYTLVGGDDPNAAQSDWIYPAHTGTGADSVTITLSALFANGDTSVTPGAQGDPANGGRLILTPVPEPSGALLAGFAGMLIAFRRRR